MSARYVIALQVPGQPPQLREFAQARVVLGRVAGDLVLGDPQCSSTHAELDFDGRSVQLRDLGSTNGTWFQGQRIQDLSWKVGTTVQIGACQLTLQEIQPELVGKGGTVMAPLAGLRPQGYVLQVTAPDGEVRSLALEAARVVVGRTQGDLLLADPGCSSTHAELLFQGTRLVLRDLGSTNGTWLGEQRITELAWEPGQVVRIGTHRLQVLEVHGASGPQGTAPAGIPVAVPSAQVVSLPPRPLATGHPQPPRNKSRAGLWITLAAGGLVLVGLGAWASVYLARTLLPEKRAMTEAREATVRFVWFAGQPGPGATGGTAPARIRVGPNRAGTVSVGVSEEFAGGGGNQWRTATWLAAFNATRTMGASLADYEFNVHVGGHADGPSAGMITTAAMLALMRGKELRADTTMTGTINPDGTAGPVGGIVQKMEGAQKAGLKRFGFPIGCRNHKDMKTGQDVDLMVVGQRLGLEVKEIGDLDEGYAFLTGDHLPRTEPLPESEMEPSAQTQALLRAKVEAWKARIQRDLGNLRQDAQQKGVPPQLFSPLLASAEKAFETAQRDARNGFLAPALGGYVETAIAISVASRLTAAYTRMLARDINGLMEANQTAANIKGEVEAFGDQLEVKAQARTRGGQINTVHAFTTYVEARAATMIGDDFHANATALIKAIQEGKVALTPQSFAVLLQRVTLPCIFYDISRVYLDAAKDIQDLISDEGAAPALGDKVVDRTVSGYASGAAAVLAYFDALITAEVAKGRGLSMEEAQAAIANKEMEYYLARKANMLSEYTGGGQPSGGVKLMRLAAASSAFLSGAKLVNKWYSLGGSFDAQGGVVLENRRALTAQLDLARQNARAAAARAKQAVGFVPTPARLAYQVANARREGTDDEKLAALAAYWQASFWSELAATGKR